MRTPSKIRIEGEVAVAEPVIQSIKGFDADLSCRGFKFEVGKTFEVGGKIEACGNGFHACPVDQHPLSVFEFYPPAGKRFFLVEQSGATDLKETKLASAKITIGVELSLGDLAKRAADWVFSRADWKSGPVASGDGEGATASGTRGAATASGYQGAATASGKWAIAAAFGIDGTAKADETGAIALAERVNDFGPDHGKLLNVWAGMVGRDGIEPNVFYTLRDGKPVRVDR